MLSGQVEILCDVETHQVEILCDVETHRMIVPSDHQKPLHFTLNSK